MKKSENFSIKLVIVLVITVFALVAIVYLSQKDWSKDKSAVCGNGIVEGNECCDGDAWSDDCYGACDPNKFSNRCGANCQSECIPKEELIEDMEDFEEEILNEEEVIPADKPTVEDFAPIAVCGNGIVEGDEECDGSQSADWYVGACNPNKYINTCSDSCKGICIPKEPEESVAVCGNGIVEGDEWCDGDQIADWHVGLCDPSKYINQCNSSCKTECVPRPGVCGNGIIDEGEQCDGGAIMSYPELSQLFPIELTPVCGCMPGLETVHTCQSDCTQTCHCEE